MRLFVLAFAIGIAVLQQQAELPSGVVLGALAALALAFLAAGRIARARAFWRILGLAGFAAICGVIWAAGMASWRLADALPSGHEGRDIELVGVVAGLPQTTERGLRFAFDVEQSSLVVPGRISLAWYRRSSAVEPEFSPPIWLRAGERWRLTVRLRQPHGNLNPHGFDFEGWLFEQNLRATGYVRPGPAQRIDEMAWRPSYAVSRLREVLRDRMRTILPQTEGTPHPFAGILIALVVGDQKAIPPEQWQIFAQTGITHLMSISGLHVTMLAGLAWWLGQWGWSRSARLPLHMPAQTAGAIIGVTTAFFYCLLAGFAIPAQRTLFMLGVAVLARFSGRQLAPSRVLAAALLLVLILDPWAVMSAGFWLSFGAVALLLMIGSGALDAGHWLSAWGRAQWAVTLGMLPLLLALFQQFSLVSPLTNAVAIPLVSFVITPLSLLGVLPGLSPLLVLAHSICAGLMKAMTMLSYSPWTLWQQAAPPSWAVPLALAGACWLLLPRGMVTPPVRLLGLLAFLPLLTISPPRPAEGDAAVTVLDVGQGLAVHVQTHSHDLLFDAGPAFSADADSGSRIILPYLRAGGVRRLDALVISHADKDHEGGAASVLAAIPVDRIVASLPYEHPLSAQPVPYRPCRAGERWQWDGVLFEMLHPPADFDAVRSNPLSCVLRIGAAGRRFLITSDIEARAESMLLANPSWLQADVLTVPHHGSRTSSTPAFVRAVGARDAVIPVGYRSSYGHPNGAVVDRYVESGAHLHRTDLDGAVTVRMDGKGLTFRHERQAVRRYWHDID